MDAVSDLLAPADRTPSPGMSSLVAALQGASGREAITAAFETHLAGLLAAESVLVAWTEPGAPAGCACVAVADTAGGTSAAAAIAGTGIGGTVSVKWPVLRTVTREDLDTLAAAAGLLGMAVERERWRQVAEQEQARLRAVFEHAPSLIAFKNLEGRYEAVSRLCSSLFGGSEPASKTLEEIVPERVAAARIREHDAAALAAGRALEFEEHVPQADGLHVYRTTRFPVRSAAGAVLGVASIATDITEQRRLEAAGMLLAAIVEGSDDAIISKDLNGIITSWNRGAERIFGYTAAEAIGQPVAMLRSADRKDEMPRILDQLRRGERIEHYETRRRRKDGQEIEVSLSVSAIRDRFGAIVGASKIARDITDRRRAEIERVMLLSREQEARQTAELIQRVGLRISAQLDLDRLVQELTEIATQLVRARCGAFVRLGGTISALSGMAPEAYPGSLFARLNADAAARAAREEDVFRCDDLLRDPRWTAAGPESPRSYLEAAVTTRSGEVLGWMCFAHPEPARFTAAHTALVRGIAAQAAIALDNAQLFESVRHQSAELQRTNEELQRVNHDLEVFAYSASHDLQEPLRTIAISAQILERNLGAALSANDSIFLRNILTAAQRMSGLTRDLLEYTRLAAPDDRPAEAAAGGGVLAAVLENLGAAIRESGAVVTAGPLPVVAMPPSRLARVLQNLIGNAIKYRGEEQPRIEVTAAPGDECWIFSVTDNGIGIEPQYAEQIFGLFKRLHGRDRYDGSGIGLALCQRVVEQYGGRIWLEWSDPGRGSTFRFSVPGIRG